MNPLLFVHLYLLISNMLTTFVVLFIFVHLCAYLFISARNYVFIPLSLCYFLVRFFLFNLEILQQFWPQLGSMLSPEAGMFQEPTLQTLSGLPPGRPGSGSFRAAYISIQWVQVPRYRQTAAQVTYAL